MGKQKTVIVVGSSIVVVVACMVASLIALTYYEIPLFGRLPGGKDPDKQYYQLADANPVCEQEIKKEFGDRIFTLTFDDLSSRYDNDRNEFLVYAELGLKGSGLSSPVYAVCKISAISLRVRSFELFYSD